MILHVARTVRPYLQNQTGCRGQATARRDYGVNFVGIAQDLFAVSIFPPYRHPPSSLRTATCSRYPHTRTI